jgi:SAM-dependent methyltransferase
MKIFQLRNFEEYIEFKIRTSEPDLRHITELKQLIPAENIPFFYYGYSYPAKELVNFHCDFEYGSGFPIVNWRERLVCPKTGLNNRMRGSIHIADNFLNLYEDAHIYLMEQTTAMYSYFRENYANVIGSEFLGDSIFPGSTNDQGIRNEDGTNLSFKDETFDAILSFDVFEHIPDYQIAFKESHRVLKKGGRMLFSVPFVMSSEKTIIRATREIDGSINHLLPAEYHGDPVNSDGILCYQHFGWDMLGDLFKAGFSDACALIFWSKEFGYFTQQIQFLAIKDSD